MSPLLSMGALDARRQLTLVSSCCIRMRNVRFASCVARTFSTLLSYVYVRSIRPRGKTRRPKERGRRGRRGRRRRRRRRRRDRVMEQALRTLCVRSASFRFFKFSNFQIFIFKCENLLKAREDDEPNESKREGFHRLTPSRIRICLAA